MAEAGKREDGGGEPDLRTIDEAWAQLIESAWLVGLRPWEFEELTPLEWEAIIEAHNTKEERMDYRSASLCAVMANCHRDAKKRPQPYKPADFMPRRSKSQTPEEQLKIVKQINKALGGLEPL